MSHIGKFVLENVPSAVSFKNPLKNPLEPVLLVEVVGLAGEPNMGLVGRCQAFTGLKPTLEERLNLLQSFHPVMDVPRGPVPLILHSPQDLLRHLY